MQGLLGLFFVIVFLCGELELELDEIRARFDSVPKRSKRAARLSSLLVFEPLDSSLRSWAVEGADDEAAVLLMLILELASGLVAEVRSITDRLANNSFNISLTNGSRLNSPVLFRRLRESERDVLEISPFLKINTVTTLYKELLYIGLSIVRCKNWVP